MPNTNFLITKTCPCGEILYWTGRGLWLHEYEQAVKFPRDILTIPLPPGTSCILEVTDEGEPVAQYTVFTLPQPPGGIKVFDESC